MWSLWLCFLLPSVAWGLYLPHVRWTTPPATISSTYPVQSYDLGLGKNPPVPNSNAPSDDDSINMTNNVYEACQYLVEHQAVRDYPMPQPDEQPPPLSIPHHRRRHHHHHPTHRSLVGRHDDTLVLRVRHTPRSATTSKSKKHTKPILFATRGAKDMSLNTPWVTLMLHDIRATNQTN